MDLRDHFAAQFAAALVDAFTEGDELARRAYDLAEAMLAERSRRADDGGVAKRSAELCPQTPVDGEESAAIAHEPRRRERTAPPPAFHGALLDEPEPVSEPDMALDDEELDPRWFEPPYDPSWDLEARWTSEPPAATSSRPGPGLARTQPEAEEQARKERVG